MRQKIGLQIVSAKELIKQNDFNDVLKEIANIGYEGIEFIYGGPFDFYEKSSTEINEALKESKLEPLSSHVNYKELKDNFGKVVEHFRSIGCETLVIIRAGRKNLESEESIQKFANQIIDLSRKLKNHGFKLAFHTCPFDSAFEKLNDETKLEVLISNVGDKLLIQPDFGNAAVEGMNEIQFFKSLDTNFCLPHVKDGIRDLTRGIEELELKKKVFEEGAVRLGEGDVDLAGVVEFSIEQNTPWLVIEDEVSSANPLECLEKDYNYLSSLI